MQLESTIRTMLKKDSESSSVELIYEPSANSGSRKDLDVVLLALSKLDLKTKGSPSL